MNPQETNLFNMPGPRPRAIDGSPILTVSEITRAIRTVLEEQLGRVWIAGEVSNFRRPASGHCYFTLKDATAQISCVLWRGSATALRFDLKDGLALIVQGELTVYEPRGQYQLVVRRAEPIGVGALQMAFNQLKEKLGREGLFDPDRKKPLPAMPRRIALVTSPTGAAVQDMLNVILRRNPAAHVLVCPVRVQGEEAAPEIAAMIARVNGLPDVDVMVVGRGGGSIEDLWPFNEEAVARAIAASRIPVVSAVGHETDFTIADFVADVRALTPTEAAHRVTPDMAQLDATLRDASNRLGRSLMRRTAAARERVDALARNAAFRKPLERLRVREQRIDDLTHQLYRGVSHRIRLEEQRLAASAAKLESLSPLRVLGRGYSIALREADGAVVRDAATLTPGDVIRTRLHQGAFRSIVLADADRPAPQASPARAKAPARTKSPARKKTTTRKRRPKDGPQQSDV